MMEMEPEAQISALKKWTVEPINILVQDTKQCLLVDSIESRQCLLQFELSCTILPDFELHGTILYYFELSGDGSP